eukprot:TRINITY_DN58113_c0_g1_i1.p1 TRINITY_DN58113_c0_g1~~TRINITY_DN58113_c0_g1_i1.p1  ORF type:complete len:434 (+),score=35.16 TRINITY_DN58113_c0_g1_i1:54-1355(+)
MSLGSILHASHTFEINTVVDQIVNEFGVKTKLELKRRKAHVCYISSPLAGDATFCRRVRDAIRERLKVEGISLQHSDAQLLHWDYTDLEYDDCDPDSKQLSYGYVIRIDYWVEPRSRLWTLLHRLIGLPAVNGRLIAPDGDEQHVKVGSGVRSVRYSLKAFVDGELSDTWLGALDPKFFSSEDGFREVFQDVFQHMSTKLPAMAQEVPLQDPMAIACREYFLSRWVEHRCCYRGSTTTPRAEVEVTKIDVLSNCDYKEAYIHNQKMLRERGVNEAREMPVCCRGICLDKDSNEFLLFHGLEQENVQSILEQGFKVDTHNHGRMFGDGSYFSDLASKADLYSGMYGGREVKTQLLCKVSLGKFRCAGASGERASYPGAGFDSVVALPRELGGKVDHLEMVVYHYLQVLPICAVHYMHKDTCRCRFCNPCGGCST